MFARLRFFLRFAGFAVLAVALWLWMRGPTIASGSYLVVDVAGTFSESPPGNFLSRLIERGHSIAIFEEAMRKVRHDGRIAGVIVRIGALDAGWAQAEEIRSALSLVKASGKRVIAELEVELSPASKEIFIASAADAVYVSPASAPMLTGMQAQAVFLGGVWPKVDVRMQVEQIREYKSAGDELSRESMTPAHREMLESILDDVHAQLVRTLATARNLVPAELDRAINRGITKPQQLVDAGIANAVRAPSEVLAELGSGTPPETVKEEIYTRVTPASLGIGDGPSIAVVHAVGAITTGKSRPGGGSAGSRTVSEALAEAARDKDISAIVVRVASPGGSPAASDEIWLAIRDAAKKKPVIASLGDVAASGGYYLASAADRIVAAPATLTGSIGVVFFKPDVSALLERVGVHTESLSRGRYSRLFDLDKPMDAEELALVRDRINDTYRLFLERVATGRKKKPEEIDRVGGGRVWTGQQAFERGLVDEIGTFADAVHAAANAAGIHDPDKVQLVYYPKKDSLVAQLSELGGQVRAQSDPVARIAQALGEARLELLLDPGIQAVAETVPTIE